MRNQDIIECLLQEGKSLSRNERCKAEGEFDPIYIDEKITFHVRRHQRSRLVLVVLYLTLLASIASLIFYEDIPEGAQLWMKGLMGLLGLLCLLGIPSLMTNHARNASILRLVRAVQSRAPEQMPREEEGATQLPTLDAAPSLGDEAE